MFCQKLRNKIKVALRQFDKYIEEHVETALAVTTRIKNILSSPVANIITAIIPGEIDNIVRVQVLYALDKAIAVFSIVEQCKEYSALEEKLNCFLTELRQRDPNLQDAILQKLASLLAGELDGNRLKQHLYDLYTQAKYTASK